MSAFSVAWGSFSWDTIILSTKDISLPEGAILATIITNFAKTKDDLEKSINCVLTGLQQIKSF